MRASKMRPTLSCEAVVIQLSRCGADEVPETTLDQIEVHISDCPRCTRLARDTIRAALERAGALA